MYRDSTHVDVLIFVEHRDRELEVVAAVARLLREQYHLRVGVASAIFHPLVAAATSRPKVVVSTSLAQGPGFITELFRSIYGDGATYVYFNWEQILSPLNAEYRRPRDETTLTVAKHFAWGHEFAQWLVESGVEAKNITITGKPALSLLLSKAAEDGSDHKKRMAEEFGLDAQRPWLFFPMTCHFAFFSDYHIRSRIGKGSDAGTVSTHRRYVSETLDTILQWLARPPAGEPVTIILRPHPSVSVSQYRERFTAVVGEVPAHVHLSKERTAHDWLLASSACFTNYSSLALDANCIGKPSYLIEPQPFPPFLRANWFEAIPAIRSREQFDATLACPEVAPRAAFMDYHVDLSMDPISETAEHLARFAEGARGGQWSLRGLLAGIQTSPRRVIGSGLRYAATRMGIPSLVPEGLRADWFTADDVRHSIRAAATPTSPPAAPRPTVEVA